MNIAGNHWIIVSNIGCDKDAVVIYDSLYENIDASVKEKFVKQMAYMIAQHLKKWFWSGLIFRSKWEAQTVDCLLLL